MAEVITEPGRIVYLSKDGRCTHTPSGSNYHPEMVNTDELASMWAELQSALSHIEPELIKRGFPILRPTPSPPQPST